MIPKFIINTALISEANKMKKVDEVGREFLRKETPFGVLRMFLALAIMSWVLRDRGLTKIENFSTLSVVNVIIVIFAALLMLVSIIYTAAILIIYFKQREDPE